MHYKKLADSIAKSNTSSSEVIEKTECGYERHYLQLEANGAIQGFACLNYDHTNLGGHRCFIRHLSTINPEHLAQALNDVVLYIKREIPCDHIRVEIYHIKDEVTGQTKVDPLVKAVYTEKQFKWKTLKNDPITGKRAQIMQYNFSQPCIRQEPFSIKLALVFGLQDSQIERKEIPDKVCIEAPICELSLGVNNL